MAKAGININEENGGKMKQVISMMVAVLCLVAGTVWAYEIDNKVGVEIIKINVGDQGVYGAAVWLEEQDLLPTKPDGDKMSVAEAYVKMCLKNFEAGNLRATLTECEKASLKLQPGQMLKIFAPVIARAVYNERLTKPFKEEATAKDQQIAALKTVAMIARAKAEKDEAMLKSAASEAQRIKSEIAELRKEKAALVSQNEKLTGQLDASKRAFEMQAATTEDLKRELSAGLRTQISGLMKSFDESMDRRLAGFDLPDLADSIMLFSIACFVLALFLARARKADEVHSAKIMERMTAGPQKQTRLPKTYNQGGREFEVWVKDLTPGAGPSMRRPANLNSYLNRNFFINNN
ncbi:hypothetical protein A3I27_02290 [Candidatus Giovannonibacteria bacterium RIFCSPLOWO2_02_FULL_43_11b]|uniref:Uncharacterized protein n=1 Tax=Candidatus Giovannonibacteria bacterium RIFCSPHIGHO2_12_FULL_43_15 TaxID=1798341 RepID=A0A1F5WNF2_9BACT|nr:MAG: hypothetical protein A3B97_00055 [Candidatus Giovannonibacteria bacterium RIFCSPHIGHO2_02_FULL_43_32]OGF77178.1 MAG: hypothetical protein A3F23_01375 [Candidatus Giovannonibacteria bacterium RIFCSPHIGHO2_12_FULL_43_15]OGF78911.1 MAG: hypothetical protein A3A15_03350 [Candidatus Giovannonibacteria bacterium RIFCSPLOWO2_01_FULL_43_60]OGF89012.1 MAG: hypothetical protein A3I27_02290 [Candidatus Giovannonibacteria bacterium RIFCSPLOWO2_02_FULL_43_11b]OGF91487.1 MAG: hypothetical protein A3H